MLQFDLFFAALVALTLVDVATTVKGLKAGASEANPFVRRLINAFGAKEALLLIKAVCLCLVWTNPPIAPVVQWVVLSMYAAVAASNLRVLRKLKS